MPKETGIIMSGSHPVDILERRKTMTRRTWGLKEINKCPDAWELVAVFQDGLARFCTHDGSQELTVKCPYGGYGDRLRVKEIWQLQMHSGCFDIAYKDGKLKDAGSNPYMTKYKHLMERCLMWRSSLFMPRWASRILLEITEIRAERLQEITLVDCWDEGIRTIPAYNRIDAYHYLWDSLNAKRGYGWDKNNWVWVIAFKILEGVINVERK